MHGEPHPSGSAAVTAAGPVLGATTTLRLPAEDPDAQAIDALRLLTADAAARHTELAAGMVTPVWVLWSRWLRHDPTWLSWPDRDRLVLAAGHGSLLLHRLVHLLGYELGSASGQGEDHLAGGRVLPGVEPSAGPGELDLGHAVGMALAERLLAARFNTAGQQVVGHRTWVLARPDDLQDPAQHHAVTLAGHLGLGRLVVLLDDTAAGQARPGMPGQAEAVLARCSAEGWQVLTAGALDPTEVSDALSDAVADDSRPSIVAVRSEVGRTPARAGKRGWTNEARASTPCALEDVRRLGTRLRQQARAARAEWEARTAAYASVHPDLGAEWERVTDRSLPSGLEVALPVFEVGASLATATASEAVCDALGRIAVELVERPGAGQAATGSGAAAPAARERALAAVSNGMALHGGLRPYGRVPLACAGALVPWLDRAAQARLGVVVVFSDAPRVPEHTQHPAPASGPLQPSQPHESAALATLRAIDGLAVLCPADAHETAEAWAVALRRVDGPTAVVVSEQAVPVLPAPPEGSIARWGAWRVREARGPIDVVLLATGTAVAVAVATAARLEGQGVGARVVSVPWAQRLQSLGPGDRDALLPAGIPGVLVTADTAPPEPGWAALLGPHGRVLAAGADANRDGPGADPLGFDLTGIVNGVHDVVAAASCGAWS